MSDTASPPSEDGAPLQVTLEGDDAPFDVTDDRSLPLRVAAQGPPVSFDLPVEVAETAVPADVEVLPLVRFGDPNLRAVEIGDMLYAGRVADTSLEATVFSFATRDGPQVGLYLFERDLPIAVASTPPGRAPGAARTTVGPPEGTVDMVFFGPLDRDVAVVVLEADGRPVAAARPRARFALFDTLGVPQGATLHLVAHGSTGNIIHEETMDDWRGNGADTGSMDPERAWESLLESLSTWAEVREVPGGIEVRFSTQGGAPRTVEIVMTRDEWEELATVICRETPDSVRDLVLALAPDQPFLVCDGGVELLPSSTRELPPDPLDDFVPEPGGQWYTTDEAGNVTSRFADWDAEQRRRGGPSTE